MKPPRAGRGSGSARSRAAGARLSQQFDTPRLSRDTSSTTGQTRVSAIRHRLSAALTLMRPSGAGSVIAPPSYTQINKHTNKPIRAPASGTNQITAVKDGTFTTQSPRK